MCNLWLNEEAHLHLWEKSIAFTVVGPCIEFQCPNHLSAGMAGQIVKYFLERRTLWGLPIRDAAVGIGERFEGCRGTEGTNEGERDGHSPRWEPSDKVEDVTCYRVFGRGGGESRGGRWGG